MKLDMMWLLIVCLSHSLDPLHSLSPDKRDLMLSATDSCLFPSHLFPVSLPHPLSTVPNQNDSFLSNLILLTCLRRHHAPYRICWKVLLEFHQAVSSSVLCVLWTLRVEERRRATRQAASVLCLSLLHQWQTEGPSASCSPSQSMLSTLWMNKIKKPWLLRLNFSQVSTFTPGVDKFSRSSC